jgi:UDP-N-acetylmuramoyl-tripeptide--D-alanyl-D-alanine ligase
VSWRLGDVVRATGAEVARRGAASEVTAIATDTRTLAGGELFVALRGERHDAHDLLAEAAARGARGVLVERAAAAGAGPPLADLTVLAVPDTLRALGDLAAALRRRCAPCVLAITGSNGKTTTKEMLAAILAAAGGAASVLKTEGNLNNLIGVPLTLLRLLGSERHAVVEMGMNAPGEIWRLTEIADPDVAVITNVGPAHLEGVGSVAGVARAKGELFARMRAGATAVVNADDPHVAALAATVRGRAVRFGAGAEVGAEDVRTAASGAPAFRLRLGDAAVDVALGVPGRHNVANALAAAAAAHALGIGAEAIAAGLAAAAAVGSRMRVVGLPNGVTVVDDTYNANPASVAAALGHLAEARAGRRIAVLGDMLELGAASAALHREVGRRAAELGIDALILYGAHAAETAAGATAAALPARAVRILPTHEAIAGAVAAMAAAGDWVLVKGSRGQRMEEVVRLLGAAG